MVTEDDDHSSYWQSRKRDSTNKVALLFAISSVGKAGDRADHARDRSVFARNLALDITLCASQFGAHSVVMSPIQLVLWMRGEEEF